MYKSWILVWLLISTTLLSPCNCAGGDERTEQGSDVSSSQESQHQVTNEFFWELTNQHQSQPTVEVVQMWIEAISQLLGLAIQYSIKLHRTLVTRANYLRYTTRRIRGGIQRRKLMEKKWSFGAEVDFIKNLQEENRQLKEKVHSLELSVENASQTIKRIQGGQVNRKRTDSDRGDHEYSERHLRRLKRSRADSCNASLAWLNREGVKPLHITVLNQRNGEVEEISIDSVEGETVTDEELDVIPMILFIKDRYNISGAAYHEMSRLFKGMPRHYKLKHKIAELNSKWNIQPTPNNTVGVQQSLTDSLQRRIWKLRQVASPDSAFRRTNVVRVKLSGDGTCIGKRLHVTNFTYTIIDEGDRAHSFEGNYPLAIFREPENYESLKKALEDIIAEVSTLNTIVVDGEEYTIKFYIGGDWKFLAIVTGIDSASSKYSCIWCKCSSDQRYDPDTKWSITDTSNGARSIEENFHLSSRRINKFNVSNPPLFPTIPLTNVVIDNLHLFLRVADVLINLLLTELKRQDSIEKRKTFNSFDCTKHKHLHNFQQHVSDQGIPDFQFYVGRDSKQLKCRTLTGPEKLKLFKSISVKDLLPTLPEAEASSIQTLWNEFLDLHGTFSKRSDDLHAEMITVFETKARDWGKMFISTYHAKNVTPYIHAMLNHVPEFMQLHGCILSFTQEGLEKYNDIITKDYFRGTSHQSEKALRQIMEKRNRLEYFRDIDAQLPKRNEVTCSNCKSKGHNKTTCTEPCQKCMHVPYRSHLITIDGHKVPQCDQEN